MKVTLNHNAIEKFNNTEVQDMLLKVSTRIQKAAKSLVAVDTGKLQSSIRIVKTYNKVSIGSDLPYAVKEELRHPYLRPAVNQIISSMKK